MPQGLARLGADAALDKSDLVITRSERPRDEDELTGHDRMAESRQPREARDDDPSRGHRMRASVSPAIATSSGLVRMGLLKVNPVKPASR